MERWAGKVALITGVSTGIGKAAATKLLKHGMKVIGCARRGDVLQVGIVTKGTLASMKATEMCFERCKNNDVSAFIVLTDLSGIHSMQA